MFADGILPEGVEVLHLMGFDHERFTYRHLGLDFKLTGVEHARVVQELIA